MIVQITYYYYRIRLIWQIFFSIRTKITKRKLKSTRVYLDKIIIIFIYSDRKKFTLWEFFF